MSYVDLIHRLFKVNFFGGMKLGLQNCHRLQQLLHFPDRAYPIVHVAGTNGKGSVVTKIAKGLQEAGLKVGLYTSPHISCFRERIRINGEMISEHDVESTLAEIFALTEQEKIPATFFELTTFLALQYFANCQVDVAVLETGLGGRLDATNIVSPILSVITSISLDHTEILGPTIEAIAKEKAGIIKPPAPVVLGPRVPLEVSETLCFKVSGSFATFEEENRAIAEQSLNVLSSTFPLTRANILKGLEGRQPCRLEFFSAPCPTILDVAHNPDGLLHLFRAIRHRPLRLLFGLSKNKDITECLKILAQHGEAFHLVETTNGRGAARTHLQEGLLQLGVDPQHIFIDSTISDSMQHAMQKAIENNQLLVVCGSFFIMHAVRQALGLQEPCDEIDMNERMNAHV